MHMLVGITLLFVDPLGLDQCNADDRERLLEMSDLDRPSGDDRILSSCGIARAKLDTSIDTNSRFPGNVFVGEWASFLFFDSDFVFEIEFVRKIKSLIEIERGRCACVCNLDARLDNRDAKESFFLIEETMSDEAYSSVLRGLVAGSGWIYTADRFGCTSDIGQWCIYCERANEIAVVAFQRKVLPSCYSWILEHFKALPFDKVIDPPHSYGFSPRALTQEWHSLMSVEYATRP